MYFSRNNVNVKCEMGRTCSMHESNQNRTQEFAWEHLTINKLAYLRLYVMFTLIFILENRVPVVWRARYYHGRLQD